MKGNKPPICIFEYPSLEVKFVLDGGALKAYAHVEFSPDGKLLASLSGTPDYMLTLWNWQKQSIVLRSKAYSLDVFRVSFSPEVGFQNYPLTPESKPRKAFPVAIRAKDLGTILKTLLSFKDN